MLSNHRSNAVNGGRKGTPDDERMFAACKRKLWERRRCKLCGIIITSVVLSGFVFFGFFCDENLCRLTAVADSSKKSTQRQHAQLSYKPDGQQGGSADAGDNFDEADLLRDYPFDIEGNDVIVFLHMQKTGGTTFGRHLVRNLDVSPPCKCHRGRKRCDCFNRKNQLWLFSRYSVGWPCGLHADWTELQNCVNETLSKREEAARPRRFLYITMLREPLLRYLSEWKHVRRGSTWLAARLRCNGRQATLEEVPFCFDGKSAQLAKSVPSIHDDWSGVLLNDFLGCAHNLANNRQTRMLANLSLVGCYNHNALLPAQRDAIMLRSAKANLRSMAFFGLVEYQRATQYMFERTFHMKFVNDFEQYRKTHATSAHVTDEQTEHVLRVNRLDIELYRYAKELFLKRLHKMRKEDGTLGEGEGGEGGVDVARSEYEEDEEYEDDDAADGH